MQMRVSVHGFLDLSRKTLLFESSNEGLYACIIHVYTRAFIRKYKLLLSVTSVRQHMPIGAVSLFIIRLVLTIEFLQKVRDIAITRCVLRRHTFSGTDTRCDKACKIYDFHFSTRCRRALCVFDIHYCSRVSFIVYVA